MPVVSSVVFDVGNEAGGDNVTVTGELVYQPAEHAVLLQATVVVGATVSNEMVWELTASAFPALSTEKNLTVVVADTVKGAV